MRSNIAMEGWEACFLVLLDLAFGKDIPSDTTYVVKQVDSCPDVGYFFRREQPPNLIHPGACYLCFCQGDGTAVCWERGRERCDVEKFHHHRVGRSDHDSFRHTRLRRSPISLTDIFFRDATRNFFINTLPKQCKPFESSFSEGCPPEDWCLGCTICDCDANGYWDCRVLSFCDAKKNEKEETLRIGKRIIGKNHSIELNTSNTTTKPTIKVFIKFLEKQDKIKTEDKTKKNITMKSKKLNKLLISKPLKKNPEPQKSQSDKSLQKHPNGTNSNVKIIKRHIAARKPVSLERRNMTTVLNLNSNCNNSVKMGQKLVKKVMTTVQKVVRKEVEKMNTNGSKELDERKKCTEIQNKNTRRYNVKSNAAVKNKTKFHGQAIIKENYTYTRSKREILNEAQAKAENVSVITLKPDDSVIPLEIVKPNSSYANISTDRMTSASISTTPQENYFEYSIKNDVNDSTTTKNITDTTESYKIKNNVTSVKPKFNITANAKTNNKSIPTMYPDFNDLKFNKWFIIKIKPDNRKKPFKRLLLPKPNLTLFDHAFTTYKENLESKLQTNDIKRKHTTTNGQNYAYLVTRNRTGPLTYTSGKTFKVKTASGFNFPHKFFTQTNKNITVEKTIKSKLSIMKYVRKFFHKIFSKKTAESHKTYGTKEDHTLQILCENIGPCNINRKNKLILKHKLKQLNKETDTILRSIKIIKEMLHALVLPINDENSQLSKHCSFQNDALKLGVILRDDYSIKEMNTTLTDAQMSTINHIKTQTQKLIGSVKNFTDILNETLSIIKPDLVKDYSTKLPEKQQNNLKPLHKIKKMLYKYNIIQNKFMKKMYELMNEVEKKATVTTESIKTQLVDSREHNDVIEKYSRNIIENLRRLKNLAQILSSKRKKRSIMTGDGPLEYLLTLMEFLIKQNQPIYRAPAKDGIDVLIDAIRNAPGIKPIEKKVLYYNPVAKAVKLNADAGSSEQLTEEDSDSHGKDTKLKEGSTDGSSRVEKTTLDNVTLKHHIRVFKNIPQNNKLYETTTESNYNTKKRSNEVEGKTELDKFDRDVGIVKTDEVIVDDVDEDSFGNYIINSTAANSTISKQNVDEQTTFDRNIPETNTTETIPKIQFNESISSESQDVANDNSKTKLDWIEETYDREIKEFNEMNASALMPTASPRTSTAKHLENISGISAEENDNARGEKRLLQKLKTEDLMYRKQLEFLNFLDYGTEKTDFEDPGDSKDEARLDDGFPAYFV